jgi:hypothetical protein
MFVPRPILLAITLCFTGASFAAPSAAGEADVVDAEASRSGDAWRFEVTVRHDDEGWDHYADRWDIVDPATDKVLATRTLAHPHENEQPFTRSLGGVELPEGQKTVLIRARDSEHGYGGIEVELELPE